AIAGNRGRFRWGHGLPRYGRGEYTTYLLSSVANVVTSLAPFHVIILLAQWALSDAAAVGYLSALLSTVIPLRFLPAALGPVLLPEMARRYGARDAAGQRRLVAASVRALVAVTLVFAVPMPVVAPILLQVLGIPDTGEFRLLVSLLFLSELLSLGGTPLGHFLNATEHVTRHAVISVVATVAGIFIGSLAFTSLGLIGGGVMRISSDLFLVGGRLVITNRALGIMRDLRRELAAVGLGVAAMVGATLLGWPAAGLICLLGLVIAELTMLPGLAAGVRAAPGAARDSE
ncbi:MAG: hypothetical protein KBA95_18635, partial [Acidobacteria bacterium]|nr:hypothetical protein [Acidobacteriota bacterium]